MSGNGDTRLFTKTTRSQKVDSTVITVDGVIPPWWYVIRLHVFTTR